MGSVPKRAKRLESVIGICLLVILALTGVGIFIRQSNYDISRYGMDAAAVSKTEIQNSKAETGFELSTLAPAGFETLSKAESYNADSLYEKIDGKAPLYLEAGFKELTTQRFVSKSDPNLWMELYIYDMGNIRNGFCVYSVQKRAEAEASESMPLAYGTSNSMYLVHGKYYVEIIGSAESDKMVRAIMKLAQNTQANLAIEPGGGITEFAFFPQENLVPGSFKLYLVSAFGFEKLTDIFTARYKVGEENVTAFIGKRADLKEAEAIAESYRSFLIENGAVAKNTDNKTLAGKILDSYGTTEIVFTVGPFVSGIHEAEDQQAAEKTAEILINKLKSLNNE
ncbi:MAG: hypothetical protein PHQ35_06655 [Phycisphaerae bacterium]|nr:hypothetical protein [Phycisphaerae bacterium]MDD5381141.1 hypothetical protein [Phycisphaerae bacterium]